MQMNNIRKIFKNLIAPEAACILASAGEPKFINNAAMTGFTTEPITTDSENNLLEDDLSLKPAFFADENTHTIVEIITVHQEHHA